MNMIETIHQALRATIHDLFSTPSEIEGSIELHLNTDASRQQFGDLTSNCALLLAKIIKKNPLEIAQKIQEQFKHPLIKHIDCAGVGFINIFLTDEAFTATAEQLAREGARFFIDETTKKKAYSIEFVSANPTGPLHIGHGRGGIIGDVLGNILSFLGNKVTKEFYINDAGSQMQKLGMSFKIRCQQETGIAIELPEEAYHGSYLRVLAQECIKTHGEKVVEKPDSFFISYAKEHLLSRIEKTLKNYGITFDRWFSEKTLHESSAIEKVLKELDKKDLLYGADEALWFRSTNFGDDKDRVIRKKTGELTYVAADIAYAENKIERLFDNLIMVLGQDHHSYVIRLKGIMQALGYDPRRLDVILYQLVTIREGGEAVRLSKRAGRIVTLDDVIAAVGKDVARFFYLHKKADAHLDFDMELALKHTEENPVYYIQYAYVRTKSILQKAALDSRFDDRSEHDSIHLGRPERLLLKKIIALKNLLKSVSRNHQTHLLTYYTIELAQVFHNYYSHHRVISEQVEQSRGRLLLIKLLQDTFKLSFDLLGISAPEKM